MLRTSSQKSLSVNPHLETMVRPETGVESRVEIGEIDPESAIVNGIGIGTGTAGAVTIDQENGIEAGIGIDTVAKEVRNEITTAIMTGIEIIDTIEVTGTTTDTMENTRVIVITEEATGMIGTIGTIGIPKITI